MELFVLSMEQVKAIIIYHFFSAFNHNSKNINYFIPLKNQIDYSFSELFWVISLSQINVLFRNGLNRKYLLQLKNWIFMKYFSDALFTLDFLWSIGLFLFPILEIKNEIYSLFWAISLQVFWKAYQKPMDHYNSFWNTERVSF